MNVEVKKVQTLGELEAVWRLTYDAYVEYGYCAHQHDGMLRHYPHLDLIDETSVFTAHIDGKLVGTLSVTIDGPQGLHIEDAYADIADTLREEAIITGKKLGASWRLATIPNVRSQGDVVKSLFESIAEEQLTLGIDILLATFNPKHERFYQRVLGFRKIADTRLDESVKGAPAVLLRGDIDDILAALKKLSPDSSLFRSAAYYRYQINKHIPERFPLPQYKEGTTGAAYGSAMSGA